MAIPLSILYFIYLIFLGIFFVFLLFNIAHLIRYGLFTLVNFLTVAFIIIFTILIIYISWQYVNSIDWKQNFNINFYSTENVF